MNRLHCLQNKLFRIFRLTEQFFDIKMRAQRVSCQFQLSSSVEIVSSFFKFISLPILVMREIVHVQVGQCGNQIGAKVNF